MKITKVTVLPKKEERGHVEEGYASFVKDVSSSGNKTTPKLEDHTMMAKLVKMLRNDHKRDMPVSMHDHDKDMCDCPTCRDDGILGVIRKKFYGPK